MQTVTLRPASLRGPVAAPPSKSELHRLLICAALSEGETYIRCAVPSADTLAAAACLRALGATVEQRNEIIYVNRASFLAERATLCCGESGAVLRFFLPVMAALGCGGELRLRGRLGARPIEPLLELLRRSGCTISRTENSICLSGRLLPGDYVVDATVSSQFLSGLLLALPLLPGSSAAASGTLVSENYVNLTTAVMARFGVTVSCENGVYRTSGAYRSPGALNPEGDWSAAANWLCANALGAEIALSGLAEGSLQPDRSVTEHLAALCRGSAVLNMAAAPDLLPPLAVVAACTAGETRFVGAARLRTKESDRLAAVSTLLTALGGDCTETPDGLTVRGTNGLRGGTANAFGDHRIAMAAALAATVCTAPVTLRGADCVEKSYPSFWADYAKLGGIVL